jgi:hypothetical protein
MFKVNSFSSWWASLIGHIARKKNIHTIDNHKIDNNVAFPFGLNNVGLKGWIWTKEMGQSVML